MSVQRNNLSATQVELVVAVSADEMEKYSIKAAQKLSETTSIEGFRPGKAPYELVKNRVGEMVILEEASRLAVNKTIDQAITEQITEEWIGQPQITISKLAPGNPFEYRALITLLPTVELGEYKGLNIPKETLVVKDEEVEKMIEQLQDMRAQEALVDRPATTGDKIVLDAQLFLDKVPLEGGQVKELTIILGKNYFVPGFDEKIIGLKAGEKREFFLTYPADYHQKNLAGQKVEFAITAKQVYSRDLPEINNEFVSAFGLKNLEELKTNIKKSIEEEKKQEAHQKFERTMIEKIISNSIVPEVPESLIQDETHTMLHELEHNVSRSGGKFADYLQSLGKTKNQLAEEFKPQAIERVKAALLLRDIIKKENITVSSEDVKKEIDNLKRQYSQQADVIKQLESEAYQRHLSNILLNRRVLEQLVTWNSAQSSKESL